MEARPEVDQMNPARLFLVIGIVVFYLPMVAQNPVPFVNLPLVPDSAKPGGRGFTLTVKGAGFVSGSVVDWDGEGLATTFVSGTKLTATVSPSNIAEPRTASVSVANPGPGGGSSNVIFFPVRRPVKAFQLREKSAGDNGLAGNMVVADFNRDGILDFASFGSQEVDVSLGNGDGTFQASYRIRDNQITDGGGLAAADFNGDGIVDLVVEITDGVYIYLGNGDGSFQLFPILTSTQTNNGAAIAGDFNRDGKMDLALGGVGLNNSGDITILLGKGDGTFEAPRYIHLNDSDWLGARFVTTADINRDGNLDLVAISDLTVGRGGHKAVFILLGKGDGSFKVSRLNQHFHFPCGCLVLADFNADGNLDLAIPDNPGIHGNVLISLGNGDGTFGSPSAFRYPGSVYGGIEVGDFNGDGVPDLALAADSRQSLYVLRGKGDGTFGLPLKFHSTLYTASYLAMGDFNSDGKLDLLFGASPDFGGVDIYLQGLAH
jgi:FG-GAP-like repeat